MLSPAIKSAIILTAVCGHGHFDLTSYEAFLAGELVDYDYPEEAVANAMERVPVITPGS